MGDGKKIEFNYGDASVRFGNNGKIKYKNDKDGKLKPLQNIFDAIAGLDKKSNKIDTESEQNLIKMLKEIFSADGSNDISEAELEWAKGFTGSDVVQFINTKYEEVQNKQPAVTNEKTDFQKGEEEAQDADGTQREEQQNLADAEEPAAPKENAKEDLMARRAAFSRGVNKIKEKLSDDTVEQADYTIVKGDSFWNIAKKNLIAEGVEKPTDKQIIERIALLAKINGIDDVTTYKLRPNNTIKVKAAETAAEAEEAEAVEEPEAVVEEETPSEEEVTTDESVEEESENSPAVSPLEPTEPYKESNRIKIRSVDDTKQQKTERTWFKRAEVSDFDSENNIVSKKKLRKNGKPAKAEYFDENGKITRKVKYDRNGNIKKIIEYDENGNRIAVSKPNKEGNLESKPGKAKFEYYTKDNEVKGVKSVLTQDTKTEYRADGTAEVVSDYIQKTKTVYKQGGIGIWSITKFSDGEFKTREIYERSGNFYNEYQDGQIVKRTYSDKSVIEFHDGKEVKYTCADGTVIDFQNAYDMVYDNDGVIRDCYINKEEDDNGQWTSRINFFDYQLNFVETCIRYDDGKIKEVRTFVDDRLSHKSNYAPDGVTSTKEINYYLDGSGYSVYEYNPETNKEKLTYYNADDTVDTQKNEEYGYDWQEKKD